MCFDTIKINKCNVENLITLHNQLVQKEGFNFDSLRVPIFSKLNIPFWKEQLKFYTDKNICEFLEFGWPVGLKFPEQIRSSSSKVRNHAGARNFPREIEKYIKKEMSYGAILGPFKSNPFTDALTLSPLNSVPKSNSTERRIIMDLSFPKGHSVNDCIDKHDYLGERVDLHYPNVDNLVDIIKQKGPHCHIFKRDLRRAYRQIPLDPKNYNLVGFSWRQHIFVDKVLPMGLTSSAYICQRITTAVSFIVKSHGVDVINYLDDFAGAEVPELSDAAYDQLKIVLQNCGLEESDEKACPPCTRMSFLGVWFDTEKMTLEVTPTRLSEILTLVNSWLSKQFANRKEVQSLIGKLNFVASCIKPGRIFISRILNLLREFDSDEQVLDLTDEFKKDIYWWSEFLLIFNGISILNLEEWTEPDQFFSCDACLSGCGGINSSQYFHCTFPNFITQQNLHINSLELLTVIVSLKVWARKGKKICIFCDNAVSVEVINHGRSRSRFLQACLREIAFICAVQECEIKAVHVKGENNRISDLLSRWDLSPLYQSEFFHLVNRNFYQEIVIDDFLFRFQHDW